jgi:type I restriction enzyme M protein
MADLLLAGDEERIRKKGMIVTVCDPCCGSGGMLTITKDHILGNGGRGGINPQAEIHLFGQEVNPETFAVCKSDLYMKEPTGKDADNIVFGSTLSNDRHTGRTFDYLIANPPYGKDWKRDQEKVEAEHERGSGGRFGPGLPRISDGQLLFLQHMLSHMKPVDEAGARVAIIMNGSPLFTGDAGSGESEIRRWIFENDWLEALIALPEQLFYNTGIATYVWVLSNRKAPERRGVVQLIDATSFWTQMRKSLGDKRREIPQDKAEQILLLLGGFKEGEYVKIFPTTQFGFRKITVDRPLRLNFQSSVERIARLEQESAFKNLAVSKKKSAKEKAKDEEAGRKQQTAILKMLGTLPGMLFKDRTAFERALDNAIKTEGLKIPAPVRKAILAALSERDETAEVCRDSDGNPEADPELRDTESVPLSESIESYFEREVKLYVSDAWINTAVCDEKDNQVGKVGYEINFNRYFYKYTPPRPLEKIEADIKGIEKDVLEMLREVAG